jgi:hypothetical protein
VTRDAAALQVRRAGTMARAAAAARAKELALVLRGPSPTRSVHDLFPGVLCRTTSRQLAYRHGQRQLRCRF